MFSVYLRRPSWCIFGHPCFAVSDTNWVYAFHFGQSVRVAAASLSVCYAMLPTARDDVAEHNGLMFIENFRLASLILALCLRV